MSMEKIEVKELLSRLIATSKEVGRLEDQLARTPIFATEGREAISFHIDKRREVIKELAKQITDLT